MNDLVSFEHSKRIFQQASTNLDENRVLKEEALLAANPQTGMTHQLS